MKPPTSTGINPLRLLGKALLLFFLINVIFGLSNLDFGQVSMYNLLVPGRERFPFGENPGQAYNLSLFDIQAMYRSLRLDATPKTPSEYRVFTIGDSSVWGILLKPQETLAGTLDTRNLMICGKQARFYNLGYPSLSLAKDLVLLKQAMPYKPDLIIWLTTLEAFPRDRQLVAPLAANNPNLVRALINDYHLHLDPQDPALVEPTFLDRTIIGQRGSLMDLVRLQLLGVMWGATGIDQVYPADYPPAAVDQLADQGFHNLTPATFDRQSLAFDLLQAGQTLAGSTPVLWVNEPMLISQGKNSQIRYNFFYPRWAYDRYRELLGETAQAQGMMLLDTWNLVPASQFTNSAIHLTPSGENLLADKIQSALPGMCR